MLTPELETLILAERMTARDPDDEPPALPDGVRVVILTAAGEVATRWEWPGSIRWWEAIAWRAEDGLGNSVDADADDDDDWDD